jgi:hypothetical protein
MKILIIPMLLLCLLQGACRTWGIVTRKLEIEDRFSKICRPITSLWGKNFREYEPIYGFRSRFLSMSDRVLDFSVCAAEKIVPKENVPDMELLEFLGSFEDGDAGWIDPFDIPVEDGDNTDGKPEEDKSDER